MKRRFERSIHFPPCAPGRASEYAFEEDADERQVRIAERHRENSLRKLSRLKARWDEQDRAQIKRRLKQLEAAIAVDRKWIAEEEEKERQRMAAEAETQRRADYYISEQHKELLARLAKATAIVNRDLIRTERETLLKRGVVRGRSTRAKF